MKEINEYDVFLSYNSQDKQAVEHIARLLKTNGVRIWFDRWNLRPGSRWQEELENIIETCKTAAVFVGPNGIGPWENIEMRACLTQFANRRLPVIPVILPGLESPPKLPLFLQSFYYLDYRMGLHDRETLERLIWGITGEKPAELAVSHKSGVLSYSNLPMPKLQFVNRKQEFEHAISILLKRSPFVISGIGGIGKSALALHIAHHLAKKAFFRGGVFWCDIGKHTDIEQTTQIIASKLGVRSIGEFHSDHRFPFLASYVAEHNILLVVDNILNREVAESIVHHFQDTAVLLTTRCNRLSGELLDLTQQICSLQKLPQKDATSLLLRVSGKNESSLDKKEAKQVKEICKLVGCHPMAVTMLGSAKSQESSSFEAIRKEWKEILHEQNFDRVFQFTYAHLGEQNCDAQTIFRYISIFPASFSTEAVKEITASPSIRTTRKFLKELLQRSLISQIEEERFLLHDLVREFGHAKLIACGEKPSVLDRYVNYYSLLVKQIRANFKEFHLEAKNALSAFTYAYQTTSVEAAITIADGLTSYLKGTGWLKIQCELWEKCVNLCRKCKSSSLAHALWQYAESLWNLSEVTKGEAVAQEALRKARENHDSTTEARCLYTLSRFYIRITLPEAKTKVEEALQKSKDAKTLSLCLRHLASIYFTQGRWEEALDKFNEGLEYSRATGLADEIAWTQARIGHVLNALGKPDEAEQTLEQALVLSRQAGERMAEAICLYYLGSVLDSRGQFQEAIRCYEQSLAIRKTMGSVNHIGTCLHAIGYCKARLGYYEEAERLFHQSLKIKRELDEPRGIAPSLEWLARLAAKRGNTKQAEEYAQESLNLYLSLGSPQAKKVKKLLDEWSTEE